jgi:PhoH-like ATPase
VQVSQPTIKTPQSLRDNPLGAPLVDEEMVDSAEFPSANRVSLVNENSLPLAEVPDGEAPLPIELLNAGVRLTVVLDTSVLVADPSSIHGYGHCDVVLPLTVIEELDGHKTRRDDVGQAAREALRTIEVLRNAHDGDIRTAVSLPNGGTVRVETNGVHLDTLRAVGLDVTKADNRILGACCGLRDGGATVQMVTNDTALRIKAAQLGFKATVHERVNRGVVDQGYGHFPDFEVTDTLMADLYRAGKRDLSFEDVGLEDREITSLEANCFGLANTPDDSVLVRAVGKGLRPILTNLRAHGLQPRSKEQIAALSLLLDPSVSVVALDGIAGTGKTILALAAGLEQVVGRKPRYERLAIYRPIVPVGKADVGFLPGNLEEKLEPWMSAIIDALSGLIDDRSFFTAQEQVREYVEHGKLSMESVTFLRGRTLRSSFIVVDEAQNLEPTTVKTILTRVGEGTKIVFCGDRDQIDAPYLSKHNNGLAVLLDAFRGQECFGGVLLRTCERSAVASLAAELL